MLIRRLHPTLDAEGAVGGVATQASGEQTQEPSTTTTEPKNEQGGADERKPGEEIKSDAQKMADWMLAKRLEGISREELDTIKENKKDIFAYLESRKTEADRIAEARRKANEAEQKAAAREARADAMMQAIKAGIKAEHIEDAVILALAKVSDDTTLEDAIGQVAKGNPSWRTGVDLPGTGGNPASGGEGRKEPPVLI